MNQGDIDPRFDDTGFERRVAQGLRSYAEEGVQPFDAVEIAHTAARGRRRGRAAGGPAASGLPGPLRWVVLSGAAAVLLVATLVGLELITPDPELGPSPTIAGAVSPSPRPADGRSPAPVIDPGLTADPGQSAGPSRTTAPSTGVPAPTDMAAGPPDTPQPGATISLPVTPQPGPTAIPSPPPSPGPEPTDDLPSLAATAVAAGDLHYCAIRSDGTVVCWGENSEGELGDGTTADRWTASVPVTGLDDARDVAAGTRFSCAVRADGSVWCWGAGIQGGGGSLTPQRVPDVAGATAVTAGAAHACALLADGRVTCWGLGQLGQLGNGSIVHNTGNQPVMVSGIEDARQVSAGWNHTCALRRDGSVWCWGGNGDGATGYGQIGDGGYENAPSPVQAQGITDATSVAAGGWSSCAALAEGSVWCWGYGERGGLGDGLGESSPLPVQVSGIGNARQVSVGGWHACALRVGGSLACWGANDGQLGDGTRQDRLSPVDVEGLGAVTELSAGWIDTCAVNDGGGLWCWGSNHGSTPTRQSVGGAQ